MSLYTLNGDGYRIRLSDEGGTVVDGTWNGIPIFRPYPDAISGKINPLKCGSFPLIPFGNRVEKNVFSFQGRCYQLNPNTNWDRHYVHGDGWLNQWKVVSHSEHQLCMDFVWDSDVYIYHARQRFEVSKGEFVITLELKNTGQTPMPFGIGHHPFFLLTPDTTLHALAQSYWTEKHDYLPGTLTNLPESQDYSRPKIIPTGWINNGFEGWNGLARITWIDLEGVLDIKAQGFDRYFLFRSDKSFDPAYQDDFFCFEPMTHSANGQNIENSGLKVLAPNEAMTAKVSYQYTQLA
ncbi:conserved hypothetical protein [Vibrio nigripulchritudo SOn1]|uniref:Aldose 1-epimerase n=1 Tax=Vibrio nigripulchritudo SOn1 TaxID=1238450 RepID=A0AAV2W0G7_9VIBR|nr:aldose 1-epimerase [Vibrio nigripulchritudo]CCO50348.1 conserved hypothetical protein [Vibrio nigripulchritudo SOn1]